MRINYISFYKTSEFEVPLINKQILAVTNPQLYNDSILTFVDNRNYLIRFFNLKSNSYCDSIDIDVFAKVNGLQYVLAYNIIDRDSIILAFNPTYLADLHDSVVIMINSKKEVIKSFSFKGAPVPLLNNNLRKEKDFSYAIFARFPVIFDREKKASIACINPFNKVPCDSSYFQNPPVYMGWIYLDTAQKFKPVDFKFDCPGPGVYYPNSTDILKGDIGPDNNLVLMFGNDSKIGVYNYKNEILTNHYIKSIYLDSIHPSKTSFETFEVDSFPEYMKIIYDKFNNNYIRILKMPIYSNSSIDIRNNPKYLIDILDEDFKLIGEGVLPFGCRHIIVPHKDGLLVFNGYESVQSGRITWDLLKYNFTAVPVDSLKKRIKADLESKIPVNISASEYLNRITKKDVNGKKYVLIPIANTCPNCLESFGRYLEEEKDSLKYENIEVILLTDNRKNAEAFIDLHKVQYLNGKVLFIDDKNSYKSAFPPWIDMKLLIFDESGKMTKDQVYEPYMLNSLYDILESDKN
jgi:hypothetical protein